jgi:hypothetical protein
MNGVVKAPLDKEAEHGVRDRVHEPYEVKSRAPLRSGQTADGK